MEDTPDGKKTRVVRRKINPESSEQDKKDKIYKEFQEQSTVSIVDIDSESRKIYLFDTIDSETVSAVVSYIHYLEKKNSKKDIDFYINSDGGYVLDSFALIDVMNCCKCDISTIILGRAASAACLVSSNGTQGKRYAGANSEIMYHQSSGDISDARIDDMKYWENEFKRIESKCNNIFSKNTGQNIKIIKEKFLSTSLDKWMDAKEAKAFGIIDKILPVKRRNIIEK